MEILWELLSYARWYMWFLRFALDLTRTFTVPEECLSSSHKGTFGFENSQKRWGKYFHVPHLLLTVEWRVLSSFCVRFHSTTMLKRVSFSCISFVAQSYLFFSLWNPVQEYCWNIQAFSGIRSRIDKQYLSACAGVVTAFASMLLGPVFSSRSKSECCSKSFISCSR